MKILLISASYPPVLGGLQTVVSKLAGEFCARGHVVRVITNHYPRALPRREVLNGIEVVREQFLSPSFQDLQRGRADLFAASLWYSPYTAYMLEKEWKSFQPDVVNIHFPDAQIPFVLRSKEKLATRVITSLHGDEIERWFQDTPQNQTGTIDQKHQLQVIMQKSDAVTACSRYLLDLAVQLEPGVAEKGQVIWNGIDLSRFQITSQYHHPRPYIFAYGRFTQKKGFDLLLQAFAEVCQYKDHIDLILAGEGEDGQKLKDLVVQYDISGRVFFFGRAAPDEVVKLLNGCLFVVIPSRQEPFGIVGLEAMAARKPIIASKVGGLPEVIKGDGTLLVEPNADQFAQAIKQWLEYPPTVSSSEETIIRHDWSTVADAYESVLKGQL